MSEQTRNLSKQNESLCPHGYDRRITWCVWCEDPARMTGTAQMGPLPVTTTISARSLAEDAHTVGRQQPSKLHDAGSSPAGHANIPFTSNERLCRGCEHKIPWDWVFCAWCGEENDRISGNSSAPETKASECNVKLDELAALPHNWDSYGGIPPRGDCLAKARQIAPLLPGAWSIVPMSNGGIQLEQHSSGLDIELMIEGASAQETNTDGWKCVGCGHENPKGILRCQGPKCTVLAYSPEKASTGPHLGDPHPPSCACWECCK